MTQFEAATLYAGLLVLLLLALKVNTGRARGGAKITIGDGGNDSLIRAMRTHANAVEDVPITLIGIFALAGLSAPLALIHALGASLVVTRLLHALGLGRNSGTSFGRFAGTLGTLLVMLVTAGACLWFALM
ncbi:MAG: MAPEG family protein [Hyphomonadaceae bacterium]|nr:MAPEG family protein [Hyphomonadaceae bacterium]